MSKIQLRRGTTEEWANLDPILLNGEPGVDLTTGFIKVGNGEDPWSELPFAVGGGEGGVGAQGPQGIPGPKGDKGDTGLQGAQGPAGAAGSLNAIPKGDITAIEVVSQTEYDALTPVSTTLYVIV